MKRLTTSLLIITCCMTAISNAQTHYDFKKIHTEKPGRGTVAIKEDSTTVAISWRYLSSDPIETSFNIYRNDSMIGHVPEGTGTFYKDKHYKSNTPANYAVYPVINNIEYREKGASYQLPDNVPTGYINIPLDKPQNGITPAGDVYSYSPNDASIGDVDGNGNYEIILKWDPSNSHDNAHDGYTGNVFIDCYRLNGEKLWRIDLGKNIRAGAHYTQFMVFDFDGDGKAEVAMRTSDGTIDGKGNIIGDATADYRETGISEPTDKSNASNQQSGKRNSVHRHQGRILTGNEYLTIFNGQTGEAMSTINYIPPRGDVNKWGDNRANRSDRFLAAVAYLDGVHPSLIMCRGYYTRTVLAAFDWDGKNLQNRWIFDSNTPGCHDYAGQGNHNLRIADVDGDGCDEIIYGSCTFDHDGKGLYSTGMGHGDAIHLTQFDPENPKLQVWACHENKKDGSSFRDAATGKIIFQTPSSRDVGRCMAADIDPTNKGVEMWSQASGGLRNIHGEIIAPPVPGLSCNMAVWWDGDLLRELLDKNIISKYDWQKKTCSPIKVLEGCESNNGTKAPPSLQGDIVGDWREEVLMRSADNSSLRLYVSTIETPYRFHSFVEDPVYRISIATQNVAYNQPTQAGFYFGPDLKKGIFRGYPIK